MKIDLNQNFTKNLILLHIIVFIWGFTGILGKYISLSSTVIVWYRMLIAFVTLFIILIVRSKNPAISFPKMLVYFLVGGCIALHWIFFFEAIKLSNVSLALSVMATTSFFTALIEPLVFRRRIIGYELIMGILVIAGVYLIFRFEVSYGLAIPIALLSAFLAAVFTVINAQLVRKESSSVITFYELIGGWLLITIYLAYDGQLTQDLSSMSVTDAVSLLILGIICTAFAFVASVEIMKTLSAYTVAISVNMEPVYSIVLALMIFGESEKMTAGFYFGALIIISAVIINVYLKRTGWKKYLSGT